MDGFRESLCQLSDDANQLRKSAKKETKANIMWNFMGKGKLQAKSSLKLTRQLTKHARMTNMKVVNCYQLDMAGYTLVPVGEELYAIQTAFLHKKKSHAIRFFKVIQRDENGDPMKQPYLAPLGANHEHEVRQGTDYVQNYLNNQLVSFKIIG